jgi:hypothetical protein
MYYLSGHIQVPAEDMVLGVLLIKNGWKSRINVATVCDLDRHATANVCANIL